MVLGPEYLNHNMATSNALYTYLATSVDRCRPESVKLYLSSLVAVTSHVVAYAAMEVQRSANNSVIVDSIDLGTGSIIIDRDGQVAGFRACLSGGHTPMAVHRRLRRDP